MEAKEDKPAGTGLPQIELAWEGTCSDQVNLPPWKGEAFAMQGCPGENESYYRDFYGGKSKAFYL